jgi:hypothetical protein
MALDEGFVEECPYAEEALLIDEILEVDRSGPGRVRARMPTTADLPLTRDQRVHPIRHPRHVNGALMVHATAILGFVHAYYVLDLRFAEGWIGYGTHIKSARFPRMATVDRPLELTCQATELRRIRGSIFARYDFTFTQGGDLVYEGDGSAIWTRLGVAAAAAG